VRLLSLVFFFLVLFSWPNSAQSQERPPERVISLGPVTTEEIYLLSSQDKLVADTIYCVRPPEAKLKEKIGSIEDFNLEKIVSLKPDLVLATELTNPQAVAKLRSLGVRVENIPNARNFGDICRTFLTLGRLLGKEKQAQAIIAKVQAQVEVLKAVVVHAPKVSVIVQVGSNPLVVVGRNTFPDDFIQSAGGTNAVKAQGYLQYSMEKVLGDNPEVMIISSMGFDGEQEKANWEKFSILSPVIHHKIFIIDQYLLCSPTPVSFVGTLKIMIHDLHPEIRS